MLNQFRIYDRDLGWRDDDTLFDAYLDAHSSLRHRSITTGRRWALKDMCSGELLIYDPTVEKVVHADDSFESRVEAATSDMQAYENTENLVQVLANYGLKIVNK